MAKSTTGQAGIFRSITSGWQRISPRLVPLLAIITAFIIGIPFMIVTGGRGDIASGLSIAGSAYSALIEGSTGLVVNDRVSPDNLSQAARLAAVSPLTPSDLTSLSRAITRVSVTGIENVRRYGQVLADVGEEALAGAAEVNPDVERIGAERLQAIQPLVNDLLQLPRSQVRQLADPYLTRISLTAEDRAAVEALAPSAASYSDADLLAAMQLIRAEGIASLETLVQQAVPAETVQLDEATAAALDEITTLGLTSVREWVAVQALLDEAGVTDLAAASEQVLLVRRIYDAGLLSQQDIHTALTEELDTALVENLVVRRPGNRLLVGTGFSAPAGILYTTGSTPAADRPETVYLRLGGSALLFFPANLETTIVRSIPYIIAGLAVALAFKAGLFNIGAEGQLYIGATFAVWVGYSPLFDAPQMFHLPLMIIAGLIGGALWGAIPGLLKAYTGAHEVINTIMLNFVAILLVDWLIKSANPVIMQDPTASIPRTPFIANSARLPLFSGLNPIYFVVIGVLVGVVLLARSYGRIRENWRYSLRPLLIGLLVALGGLFLSWMSVRNSLHLGLIVMVAAVWFTDWFLQRTTYGFELRTVGANPDAARYSGMSVPRNLVLAMALSGALAGLAGTVQISGVQFNMQPAFFAGLGFDAIAVALLARTNPRNMIPAGLLWGALLTGAGLMQINANISVDLVRIIQALIIMFIAADAIIRYLWRVPLANKEENLITTFSKGWGG